MARLPQSCKPPNAPGRIVLVVGVWAMFFPWESPFVDGYSEVNRALHFSSVGFQSGGRLLTDDWSIELVAPSPAVVGK